MPIAKVYVPEGILTPEQRREIVKGIHEVILTVEKRPLSSPTYVQVNEVPARDWGFTGKIYEPGTK
jgi:phenylpyruvate tautomerase PptA (4-oxalocrotonate tautomerase family)